MTHDPQPPDDPDSPDQRETWQPRQGPITRVMVWVILIAMAIFFLAMIVLIFAS